MELPPPPQVTENELLAFNRFTMILQNILMITKDQFENILLKFFPTEDNDELDDCVGIWKTVSELAFVLLEARDKVLSTEKFVRNVKKIIKCFVSTEPLVIKALSDVDLFVSNLELLEKRLSNIVNELPKKKRFTILPIQDDQRAKRALNDFIQAGESIIGSPDYENSRLDKLDRLLVTVDMLDVIKETIPNVDMQLVTENSFVAIAAPSLEGKTQAAFTFRRVKPLYFPLSEDGSETDSMYKQQIYQNFKSHVDTLKNCADEDLKIIGEANFGASSLQSKATVGLWTLGFLKRIVELSELNYNHENNWMDYYANMADFNFEQASIGSIPIGYFSTFCLFLDEFTSKPWAIFVRNLARALQMKCLCANTNTKVANIVGTPRNSGGGGDLLWSAVITSLNPPCEHLLNESLHLDESIEIIKNYSLRDQENGNPVCEFLDDFRSVQLKSLRAGVAVYTAKILKYLADQLLRDNLSINLGSLTDFITSQLSNYLKFRKPSLKNEKSATYGKIALLFPSTYSKIEPEFDSDVSEDEEDEIQEEEQEEDENQVEVVQVEGNSDKSSTFCNQGKFLEHHLFYLLNPHNPDNWMFLTMPPAADDTNKSLIIFPRKVWDEEYTYFEPDEIFTRLASLFIPYDRTVKTILSQAKRATHRRSSAVHDTPNPNAYKFPANPLEVLTAVSVVDASQHSFSMQTGQHLNLITGASSDITERKYSFAGQNGTVFIQNLIINLIKSGTNSVLYLAHNDPLAVFYFHSSENFDLKIDFLDQCLVPFLYSIDHDIPILDKFSVPGSGFFTSKYERTADEKQIDGKFKVQFNGRLANVSTECKNWKIPLGSDKLLEILEKALLPGNDSCLSLIFCRNSVSPTARNSCREYCSNVRINVYRVTKIRNTSLNFFIVPFFGEEMIFSDPRMVCIIFESESIARNQIF